MKLLLTVLVIFGLVAFGVAQVPLTGTESDEVDDIQFPKEELDKEATVDAPEEEEQADEEEPEENQDLYDEDSPIAKLKVDDDDDLEDPKRRGAKKRPRVCRRPYRPHRHCSKKGRKRVCKLCCVHCRKVFKHCHPLRKFCFLKRFCRRVRYGPRRGRLRCFCKRICIRAQVACIFAHRCYVSGCRPLRG